MSAMGSERAGQVGGDCSHPEQERDESISHLGDPEWAFCHGCACVLHIEDGKWAAQRRPRMYVGGRRVK